MAIVANFTYLLTAGSVGIPPFTVQFTDTSTGTPTNWIWDFGDGSSVSELQNPSHTFQGAGPFTVKLKAFTILSSSTVNPTHIGGKLKNITYGPSSNLELLNTNGHAAFLAASWSNVAISGGSQGRYNQTYSWVSGSSYNIHYNALKLDRSYDLTGKLPGDWLGVWDVRVLINIQESGLRAENTDTSLEYETLPADKFTQDGSNFHLGFRDIEDVLNTSFNYTLLDGNGYPKLSTPGAGGIRGWSLDTTSQNDRIRLFEINQKDTISKEIVALSADFVGTPVYGSNIQTVDFTDLSSDGVASWSWRKRKAGTSDAFVEFSTIENPSQNFDKENP